MSDPKMTESEHLNLRAIIIVGALALGIFFLASLWANWILGRGIQELQPQGAGPAPSSRRAEVGMVNQQLFELDDRAIVTRDAQLRRLGAYGWVDPDAGVVHIPIERAMEQVLQGASR